MYFTKEKISKDIKLRKEMFWDCDFENIDFDKEKEFVVSRVLDYGNFSDYYAIFYIYNGIDNVKDIIKGLNYINKENIPFLYYALGIRKEELKCLSMKQ